MTVILRDVFQRQNQSVLFMKPSGASWLGDIPGNWDFPRIHSLFYEVNDRYSPQEDGEWPLLSVSEYYGVAPRAEKIDEDAILVRAETLDGYKKCQPGDLVINIMLAWKNALGVAPCAGIVSPAYCVYRAREGVEPRYYHHLFRTKRYGDVFRTASTGIIDSRLRLYSDKFFAIHAPLPPPSEQRAIAAFLDDKCAAIDALADEAKASLSEYADWKRSIIFHAVTKGIPADGGGRLSPAAAARGDARPPMKDSGVEWIGNIPAHWQCTRVGRLFSDILGKMLANEPATKSDTFEPYVCAKDVHFSGIDTSNLKKMWFSPDERELYRTRDTDLLVVEGGAGAGGAAVVSDGGGYFIQNSIHLVRAKHPLASTFYLRYWIFAAVSQGYIGFICNKATIPHFTKEKLLDMAMPLPPLAEQRAIAAWLDEKCAAIEALVEEKKKLIEDLGAYKKSLIYETVTGKRRVEG